MKTAIKEIIDYKELKIEDYEDEHALYDALDYDGSIHEAIDGEIDIYNHSLRQWAVDNYNHIEDALEEGLCEGVTDFHKLIQIGQYVALSQEAREAVAELFEEMQEG